MARRKLKDHFTPEGRLPLTKWKTEYGKLQQAYQEEYAKYKPIREDLMKLYQAKSAVDIARPQQEQTHTQRRDRDMER
jgi:predicted patatin/cPLA2 family phospholipase